MLQNNIYGGPMLEDTSAEFTGMYIQGTAGAKLDNGFSTTISVITNNNNNELYTNRNTYGYQSAAGQEAPQVQEIVRNRDSLLGSCTKDDPGQSPSNSALVDETASTEVVPFSYHSNAAADDRRRQALEALRDLIMKIRFRLARRPINDFLMFCKRHRCITSKHFTSKENRYVTKKLGRWWRQLSLEQKHPYKKLANQHKASCLLTQLLAFPENWYVLQQDLPQLQSEPGPLTVAVPQRSPGSIQSSSEEHDEIITAEQHAGSMEVAKCLVDMAAGVGLPPMTTFKLADETQMGSLSSLMVSGNGTTMHASRTDIGTFEHNYSATQNYAAEPTESHGSSYQRIEPYSQDLGMNGNDREEPCQLMRQHFLSQSRPKPNLPVQMNSENVGIATHLTSLLPLSIVEHRPAVHANAPTPRATRACKGKRYQEFMNQQQVRTPNGGGSSSTRRKLPPKRPAPSTVTTGSVAAASNDSSNVARWTAAACNPDAPGAGIATMASALFEDVPDGLGVFVKYDQMYETIDQLPCFDLDEFLEKYKGEKKRKKPYALSYKAAKKRKPLLPKSSISCPSSDAIASTSATPPSVPPTIATSPVALPKPMPPTIVASPVALPEPVPPAPTVPLPPAVPTKIVGCRKRKAPKEQITRHTVLLKD